MCTTAIGVDIPHFGDPRRTATVQSVLRQRLYEHLESAFEISGLPWKDCHREDRGDGALIVFPPHVQAVKALDPLTYHLNGLLRRSNQLASSICRLRMRVAVHAGDIQHDAYGVLGQPLTRLYRLLDAPAFKAALDAAPEADLGLLVSHSLFQEATASGFIDPGDYRTLRIEHKETRTRGHLWLPPSYRSSGNRR